MNSDFYTRRAIQLLREQEEAEARELAANPPLPIETLPDAQSGNIQTIVRNSSLLLKGIAAGSASGFVIGNIYAFKTRHVNPFGVGISAAVSMGLVFGQFTGFRYILPQSLSKHYQNVAGDEGSLVQEVLETPGFPMPAFLADITEDNVAVVGSGLAGGISGYITNRLRAQEISSQVKGGNLHSIGARGAAVWGLFFSLGHLALQYADEWRRNRLAKRAIRELYARGDTETLSKLLQVDEESVPSRESVISLSWRQMVQSPILFFKEYDLDLSWMLPFVHDDDEFERRAYLESKNRILVEEVAELKRRLHSTSGNRK